MLQLDRVSAAEHSKLIYLLDALAAAPGKREELLSIAAGSEASASYRRALQRLRQASDESLPAFCEEIRNALR